MLAVDFYDKCRVSFTLIGNYFLLGSSEYGHIDRLKEAVQSQVDCMYNNVVIDWEAIDKFIADNQQSYGANEDWEQVAADLPDDNFSAMMIATVACAQKKGGKWLARSKHDEVRAIVAHSGQQLKRLVDDQSDDVRYAVAEQGYGLEQLVKDRSPRVRRAVAEQGYGLDTLIKDSITDVRCAVAAQGYQLDVMVLDKSPYVREAVAKQGYGIEQLEKDTSSIVKRGVKAYSDSQQNQAK